MHPEEYSVFTELYKLLYITIIQSKKFPFSTKYIRSSNELIETLKEFYWFQGTGPESQ